MLITPLSVPAAKMELFLGCQAMDTTQPLRLRVQCGSLGLIFDLKRFQPHTNELCSQDPRCLLAPTATASTIPLMLSPILFIRKSSLAWSAENFTVSEPVRLVWVAEFFEPNQFPNAILKVCFSWAKYLKG
jgi:hypothetical protein